MWLEGVAEGNPARTSSSSARAAAMPKMGSAPPLLVLWEPQPSPPPWPPPPPSPPWLPLPPTPPPPDSRCISATGRSATLPTNASSPSAARRTPTTTPDLPPRTPTLSATPIMDKGPSRRTATRYGPRCCAGTTSNA